MHRDQNLIREPDFGPLTSYGLGWSLGSYEGRRISRHGGAVDGMNTTLVLVPEENLGIFVTTNAFNSFMNALVNQIIDAYIGAPERDWHQAERRVHPVDRDRKSTRLN